VPNGFLQIIYQKNFEAKRWNIVVFDHQREGRQVGWVGETIEVVYSYDDGFEDGLSAKSAKAYARGRLIAVAAATKKLKTTVPYQIDIDETHYAEDQNRSTYKGTLRVRLDSEPVPGRSYIISQNALSGQKIIEIFYSWSGLRRAAGR
jgi:hypothetical protein